MKKKQVDLILFDQAKRKKKIFDYSCLIIMFAFIASIFFCLFIYLNKPEYVTYKEKSDLDYKVYLKDNPFIKDEYSKSDNQYISSMIDFVRADFSYNLDASRDVDFQYSYKIIANVNVSDKVTHKSLYKYSEELAKVDYVKLTNGSKVVLNKTVDIDYNKYNNLIKRFVNTYDIDEAQSSLDVSMYVNVKGNCDSKNSSANQSVTTLSIPLTAKTFAIDMAYDVVDADDEKIMLCEDSNLEGIMLLVVGAAFVIIAIRYVFVLVKYILLTRTAESIYDKELKKILNNYKCYIQKVENDLEFTGYKMVKIESFTDMLEIRDTIQEPILMVENKNKTGVNFYIPGKTKIVYCYSLRVSDIKIKIADKKEK